MSDPLTEAIQAENNEPAAEPVHSDPAPAENTGEPAKAEESKPSEAAPAETKAEEVKRELFKFDLAGWVGDEVKNENSLSEETFNLANKAQKALEELSTKLLARMEFSSKSVAAIAQFYSDRAKAADEHVKLLKNVHKLPTADEKDTTLHATLDTLTKLVAGEAENFASFSSFVKENTIKPLNALKDEINSAHKKSSEPLKTALKDSKAKIDEVKKLFTAYAALLKEAADAVKANKPFAKDPYPNKVQYYESIKFIATKLKEVAAQTLVLFNEVERLEKKRLDTVKEALTKSLESEQTSYSFQSHQEPAANALTAQDTAADFAKFVETLGVTDATQAAAEVEKLLPTEFTASYSNVFQAGEILRGGDCELVATGNPTVFCALTKFGSFHYYTPNAKKKGELELTASLPLNVHCTVDSNATKTTVTITSAPPGLFAAKKVIAFKTKNPEEMADWANDLKSFIPDKPVDPKAKK